MLEEKEEPIAATLRVESDNLPQSLSQVDLTPVERLITGMPELDGVLGGGLVPGSLVLLGGEPGIGKSTVLLQMALILSQHQGDVLYVSGEESSPQVKMRSERLGALKSHLLLLAENNLELIIYHAKKQKIKVLIVDSIQTVFLPELASAPGSVSQVRQCGAMLLNLAKECGISVILVGHVTKEGTLAGPRVLEHMVDTVLYFEGERSGALRLLRAVKNRFGSTNEIGVFEMTGEGLLPLNDPSAVFLAERGENVAGSAVGCVMQGSRPVLLEVQALASPSNFGNPRRLASGIDYNRLLIIVAVLEKKVGIRLQEQDIYVNLTGGLKVDDPAIDLAVAAAIVSSYKEKALPAGLVVVGEVGLTGEIRQAGQLERRLKEAAKLGFNKAVIPKERANKALDFCDTNVEKADGVSDALYKMGLI
jgi:DNA repair protein RadA/Sms